MSEEKNYMIDVIVKRYFGDLRETNNSFTFEQADLISKTLYELVRSVNKLSAKQPVKKKVKKTFWFASCTSTVAAKNKLRFSSNLFYEKSRAEEWFNDMSEDRKIHSIEIEVEE